MRTVSSSTLLTLTLLIAAAVSVSASDKDEKQTTKTNENENNNHHDTTTTTYGLDVSFPIQRPVSVNYPWLAHNNQDNVVTPRRYQDMPLQPLGNRQQLYLEHLDGCRQHYAPTNQATKCDLYEYDRMLMNNRQPTSMVNLTEVGFQKIRAPPKLKALIDAFWTQNSDKGKPEQWGAGNSYVNHWNNPTELVSVDDKGLRGSGATLKRHIWEAASATLEAWTAQELQPCSLYGIRVYHEGAIMLPHVDRLPLVASAMIAVAQDVDEPWPTEVYDHDGNAHNVTLDPGDMLLFESHSVIHGHPFPLQGRYVALIFIHFEPTGQAFGKNETSGSYYYLRGKSGEETESDTAEDSKEQSSSSKSKSKKTKKSHSELDHEYHEHAQQGFGGQSSAMDLGLPPYIQRASPEEEHWRKQHPTGWSPVRNINFYLMVTLFTDCVLTLIFHSGSLLNQQPYPTIPPEGHLAAMNGNINELEQALLKKNKQELLTERDAQGWQVLHQGVAAGNEAIVKLLVTSGAELNARTHGGYGETPLRIAEQRLGVLHPIVTYLKSLGALSIGPEL